MSSCEARLAGYCLANSDPPPTVREPPSHPNANRLFEALSSETKGRLRPYAQHVHIPKGRMLYELGGPVRYTYWPVSGLIAFVATTENAEAVSVAIVGAHGIVGVPPLVATHGSPYEVVVHLDCEAYRFPAEAVLHEFRRAEDLQRVILQHESALFRVVVQSALCHAYHSLTQRVCRWLLATRDCVGSDVIELTQESIAYLLGLSRPRVSTALADLEDKGFIRQRHGRIRVVSPRSLAECSCECYRVLKDGTHTESRVVTPVRTQTR